MASAVTELYQVVDRVEALVGLYRGLTRVGRPRRPLSDLLRGALILGLSGLDAFVHGSVTRTAGRAERLAMLGSVAQRWVNRDLIIAAMPQGKARRAAVRNLIDGKIQKTTFQRPEHIEEALAHIGVPSPWNDVATKLSTSVDPITPEEVTRRLSEMVDRRDQIAHHGDRYRHGLRPIRAEYVEDCAWLLLGLAEGIATSIARAV